MSSSLYIQAIVAVLFTICSVHAQGLDDPTRPPDTTAAPQNVREQPRLPVLQSVIITQTTRAAIINGERVELGGRVGDARVARITETEVLLRSPGRSEVLRMYPNVDKTSRRAEPDIPKRRASRN